jgi:hypothetical protein
MTTPEGKMKSQLKTIAIATLTVATVLLSIKLYAATPKPAQPSQPAPPQVWTPAASPASPNPGAPSAAPPLNPASPSKTPAAPSASSPISPARASLAFPCRSPAPPSPPNNLQTCANATPFVGAGFTPPGVNPIALHHSRGSFRNVTVSATATARSINSRGSAHARPLRQGTASAVPFQH